MNRNNPLYDEYLRKNPRPTGFGTFYEHWLYMAVYAIIGWLMSTLD